MRLVLPVPETCARRELDDDRTLIVLEGADPRPTATLTLHHPKVVQMSLLEYATEIVRSDLPAGTTAHVRSSRVTTNHVGWPMQVVHGVLTGAGGAEVESRLTAIFRFNPYRTFAAAAVARFHDPARFDALQPGLLAMFEEARPDWDGPDVASISQLYD